MSRKQRVKEYLRREIARFFGVDCCSEEHERTKWADRQKRLAHRRFGQLKPDADIIGQMGYQQPRRRVQHGDRPDILPAPSTDDAMQEQQLHHSNHHHHNHNRLDAELRQRQLVERKASVLTMMWNGVAYIVQCLQRNASGGQRQWSRSFAPGHVIQNDDTPAADMFDGLTPLHEDEVFFDSPNGNTAGQTYGGAGAAGNTTGGRNAPLTDHQSRQIYMGGERVHGWRTRSLDAAAASASSTMHHHHHHQHQQQQHQQQQSQHHQRCGYRGTRIAAQLLDGVLDNSRRPIQHGCKLLRANELDDRYDHRPYFTYWINTVQVLVLALALICYGVGPIGIGMEQKSGQVLVTSLSLQQVQHQEPQNVWIGPRGDDLVHLGAKFAACMRRDVRIMDGIAKTRRQERETACCIRNDDSGCVQSSQADCSVRGLWPTVSGDGGR